MMKNQPVYLKQNVKIEPLVWQWYAWTYLIAPITCAKLMNKHIRLMESFIMAPELHYEASKNPELLGGSFLAIEPSHLSDVKSLVELQKGECDMLLKLAEAFKSFDIKLFDIAKGYSLEKLYYQLPKALKGCVELVYDYNNQPSIRIIEPLFYKKFYPVMRSAQSVALSLVEKEHRPFSFSTPRLESSHELHLKIPFDSHLIDELSKMISQPIMFDDICNKLNLTALQRERFASLVTLDKPLISDAYQNKGVRFRYFGHACVLLESNGVSILIDPLVNYKYSASSDCFSLADLPDSIDYVLITHGHQDHLVLETLLQIRYKVKTIVVPRNQIGSFIDPSLKLLLRHVGFENIIDMDEFDNLSFPGGNILSVPFLGEHADMSVLAKMAYCITLDNKKFLFCADSNNLDNALYENIYDYTGAIDYLFLGMECEGAPMSWFFSQFLHQVPSKQDSESRRFSGSNCDKACQIVQTLKCKNVYVYAMAQEPWLTHIMAIDYSDNAEQIVESDKFIQWCQSQKVNVSRPFLKMEYIV